MWWGWRTKWYPRRLGKEKTSWKTQRRMDRRSGRGWEKNVEMQEVEKAGKGQRCLEAEDWKGQGSGWAVAPYEKEKEEEQEKKILSPSFPFLISSLDLKPFLNRLTFINLLFLITQMLLTEFTTVFPRNNLFCYHSLWFLLRAALRFLYFTRQVNCGEFLVHKLSHAEMQPARSAGKNNVGCAFYVEACARVRDWGQQFER